MKEEQTVRKTKSGWDNIFSKASASSYEKPPPFMGAFEHVQPDFSSYLNISIPKTSEYKPFSCYYEEAKDNLSNPYDKEEYSNILEGNLNDSKDKNANNKYFFEN